MAATPKTVEQLIGLGYDVLIETDAGAASAFTDDAYRAAGATIGSAPEAWGAEIVFHVNAPSDEEIALLSDGATLISLISPALSPELVDKLAARDVTAMAMDAVPRISRAQSLDVLSSMANIAGYRAVIEAANVFGRFFTGQVTAAGKVPPAKVLVAGVGVAGLAAIGTASSLGAIVRATDPRPEVADQVKSLGGEYLAIESPEVEVSATGYAKEMGEDYKARETQMYAEQAKDVDIVITTALIPGRPAPRLLTAEMVAHDEGRLGDRRHGRRQRRQRGGVAARRGRRHGQRRHHHRLHRPRGPAAGSGIAALRHEPGEPDEADDARQGRRARPGLGGRRAALDDGGPTSGENVASTGGPGVSSTRGAEGRSRSRSRRRRRARRRDASTRSPPSAPPCCS